MAHHDNDLVMQHKEWAIQARLDEERIDMHASIDSHLTFEPDTPNSMWGTAIESPLEGVFLVWWTATWFGRPTWHIKTQHEVSIPGIAAFRSDFAIWPIVMTRWNEIPLLVEVDGHAFHEKTKEQVAYRNERDRALQLAGYDVLHFSYSELTQRPSQCIDDVALAARMKFDPEFRKSFGPRLGAPNVGNE